MMQPIPLSVGTMHFVGIGGIGMSGIAEILHNLGYSVQGSDVAESPNVLRLRKMGITVHIGHKAENLEAAQVVVISSAIKGGNPEVDAARANLIPVVRRAEMLAQLMRLKSAVAIGGTHGKTTTTSLIATLLDAAKMDPTVINGGIINAYGTNARLGEGEWMVVEADESDGTFIRLPATVAVVTNIDPEHLDHYGGFEQLKDAFRTFVENVPFYGFAVLCIDHPEVQALIGRVTDRRMITYGFNPQADVRAANLTFASDGATFDVSLSERVAGSARSLIGVKLPMHGEHNVQNALASLAVGAGLGLKDRELTQGLAGFTGVKRRFTKTGEVNGITVIDDYAHHPVEISSVLKAARSAAKGRVIAVVQPHRYTRLHDLFEGFCTCFNDADLVIVADVYPAGEQPIEGADRESLVKGIRARGHRNVIALEAPGKLAALIKEQGKPGDMVVCLGAGSVSNWAQALPGELERLGAGT